MVITKDKTVMFELHLVVPVRLVQPIIELVEGEGVVVKAATLAEEAESVKRTARSKTSRSVVTESQFMSWTSGQPLLAFIRGMGDRTFTFRDVENYYKENTAFAKSTSSSCLTLATRFGLIERISKGTYRVKEKCQTKRSSGDAPFTNCL